MKKFLIVFILITVISCKSYKDFNGYASNTNAECFNDDIFTSNKIDLTKSQRDSLQELIEIIKSDKNSENYLALTSYGYINKQTNKQTSIRKIIHYYNTGNVRIIRFRYGDGGGDGRSIYKYTEYNQQGDIIKDTLYNDYTICWKEALSIAKNKARKEIQRFKVTDFNLGGYVDDDSIPKWRVELTPHGKETLDAYYDYIHWQGGEGKFKGFRNIIINANTGEVLKDYRQKVKRIPMEYDE